MGSLSHCQFSSFSSEHQPGVSSIKQLSIPFFLWNAIWLTSLPNGRERYKRPHTDKLLHKHSYVCSCRRSAKSTLGAKSGTVGAAAFGRKVGRRLCPWMGMRRWQAASFRDNPGSPEYFPLFCCSGHVHSIKIIS